MDIICITLHISVLLLTIDNNQCECMAILVYVWQSEYVREYELHTKQFYFLLLKLFLLHFLWSNKSLI